MLYNATKYRIQTKDFKTHNTFIWNTACLRISVHSLLAVIWSVKTKCMYVCITCWQSVTAGSHSVSSEWPVANISPLQHKLLHADFNLDHPGIQDISLLLLLLHWTTMMGGQVHQLLKSCETESVNILYTQAKYMILIVSDSYHLSLPVANLPCMWAPGCVRYINTMNGPTGGGKRCLWDKIITL